MMDNTQYLPATGPAREMLREKGQFWTPPWVAEAMVAYVLQDGSDHLFDPAVGSGAFFLAAKSLSKEFHRNVKLLGYELDRTALFQAAVNGLSDADLAGVEIADFIMEQPRRRFKAIVANPPYIRHHRLSVPMKAAVRALGVRLTGMALDGRAGLHIYFLLIALTLLDRDGRLAFIMPADTCEGVFAGPLWQWITSKYQLEAIITFAPDASPFPKIDTNPIIFSFAMPSLELSFFGHGLLAMIYFALSPGYWRAACRSCWNPILCFAAVSAKD